MFNGMNEELAGGMVSESQSSLTGFAIMVLLENQLPELYLLLLSKLSRPARVYM